MTFPSKVPGLPSDVNAGGQGSAPQRLTFAGYAVRLPSGRIAWPQLSFGAVSQSDMRGAAYARAQECMRYLGPDVRAGSRVVRLYAEEIP